MGRDKPEPLQPLRDFGDRAEEPTEELGPGEQQPAASRVQVESLFEAPDPPRAFVVDSNGLASPSSSHETDRAPRDQGVNLKAGRCTVLPDFDDDPATEAIEHDAPSSLPPNHQVLRSLGQTDGRECFEVLHTLLGRVLILELTPPGEGVSAWVIQRSRLVQPGVLQVYEVGTLADGRTWFTHGRPEGVGFLHWVQRATRVALVNSVVAAAKTLGSAHSMGIGHGAVRGENLRVLPSNQVVVVGWSRGEPSTDTIALAAVLAEAMGTGAPPRLAVVLQRARGGYYTDGLSLASALEDVLQVR